ncbi:complement C3-like [Odontesthes bonariensis]
MSAPNLLRVETTENIFVEIQDCVQDGAITVQIAVMNHPSKSKMLASTSVTLTNQNSYQNFGRLKIPAEDFIKDPNIKQYVCLRAQFPGRVLEKVVLVSFQPGYIFIQTDKPIYTHDNSVLYRVFAMMFDLEPKANEDQRNHLVDIEIVTPEGTTVLSEVRTLNSGIVQGKYQLPDIVSYGVWKVEAKFSSISQQTFSAEFEVKEYVASSFEVKLTPASSFLYVDSESLTVSINAKYVKVFALWMYFFDEELDGTAYAVFGVVYNGIKRRFPSSLQRVPIKGGRGEVQLMREHITKNFPNVIELMGSSIYVDVSVLTESGGEMVEAELRGIKIVASPYTIHFKRTPKYFKAGIYFVIKVEVVNPDNTPASNVAVVVDPGHIQALTSANGIAMVAIKTPASSDTMTITILSKGQLVKYGRLKLQGQVIITFILPITKEMLPSFRIVAYYHTNSDEVMSDSVWVDVKDSCMGTLKLEVMTPVTEPRRMFNLRITGDPQATVGLVAVDKSTYVLNSKNHLTQKKIWDTVEKYDTGCTPGGGKDSMNVFYDAGLLFVTNTFGTPGRTVSQYEDKESRECCLDGMRTNPVSYTCERRSEYIVNGPACVEAFMRCCKEMEKQRNKRKEEVNLLSRSKRAAEEMGDDDDYYVDSIDIYSRTHFPESICVSDRLEFTARKGFFVDLKLPYSAVYGEQLEIKAILHNYSPDSIAVRVELIEKMGVCSPAHKRRRFRQEVKVGAQTTRAVPFIIIPMKVGDIPIEVKAAVKDSYLDDGIMKTLRVVPSGRQVKSIKRITLNPETEGVGGKQVINIKSEILPTDVVPNAPMSTVIYLTAQQLTHLLTKVISGDSMDTLIIRPSGSGEENMASMTLPVIATVYLDKTNQWKTVGLQKRNEALEHIRKGYQNELAYRKSDGSFSASPDSKSSTWLTAYVAKVFAMAQNLVTVETSVICDAIKFLIFNTQEVYGLFMEEGNMSNTLMTGDVTGIDSDASMTAFCLIAMQETLTICSSKMMSESIDRAATYLEQRLPILINPYAVAIASYALANENKLNKAILYKFAAPDRSHWPLPKGDVYTLEATAYALLALVKAQAFEEARPVVKWLNQQQRLSGGYNSTQATMIVYQAVAEYWTSINAGYALDVEFQTPGQSTTRVFKFNRKNLQVTRSFQLVSQYYTLPQEQESDCEKFSMFKDKQRDASMSILDVGLPTGFTFNKHDLDSLSRGPARIIANYKADTLLSERGSLIIYLDKISNIQPVEISFRIHQEMKVGILQPAAVSVYEYSDKNCSNQIKEKVSNDERTAKSCEVTSTFRVTFGNIDTNPVGKLRTFLGYKHCKDALDLRPSKTYLIMGSDRDIRGNEQSGYNYVLSEKTWIEYWPTAEECVTEEYRATCLDMQNLVNHHLTVGCLE